MIPVYSTAQVREADSHAINEIGMPGILLMENASLEIFRIINEKAPRLKKNKSIGFLCGKGNNGGDGFASARHFANNGYTVIVVHLESPDEMSGDCNTNYNILNKLAQTNSSITIIKYESSETLSKLNKCSVLIDALLGSGASGELRDPYNKIIFYLNKSKAYKIAIDIPTGLDADKGYASTKFFADLTITLGELKKGLFFNDGYELCGQVEKGSIGLDESFFNNYKINEYLIEPEDALNFLPVKRKGINKYSSGKVLSIAGSGKYPGAAVITSRSTLKAGAGASILAFPSSVRKLIHKNLSEVVVELYEDNGSETLSPNNINELKKRIEWADVVALGPGLGRSENTLEAVTLLIKERKFRNLVVDADGIYPLNSDYKKYNLRNVIITPHLGEFSSLIGVKTDEIRKDILYYGKEFVKETGALLVLKGAPTIIFADDEVFINTSGNPGMAKFGTGDVLTGIISGFVSQQKDLLKSVISGVYLHSLSADLLKIKYTEFGYTAENIIEHFPKGIKFLRDSIAAS